MPLPWEEHFQVEDAPPVPNTKAELPPWEQHLEAEAASPRASVPPAPALATAAFPAALSTAPLPTGVIGPTLAGMGREIAEGGPAATMKAAGASVIKGALGLGGVVREAHRIQIRAVKSVLETFAPSIAAKIPERFTVKGNDATETAFDAEMDNLMDEATKVTQAKYDTLIKESGLPSATAYDVANSMLHMGVQLAIQGIGQKPSGTPGLVGHAKGGLDFAMRVAATTPGDAMERRSE